MTPSPQPAPLNSDAPTLGVAKVPLCVDLDGTLVVGDRFWEAFARLMGRRPWALAGVLREGVGHGIPGLKHALAERVTLDPATLAYRPEVLAAMEGAATAGRPVWLVTGATVRWAELIAEHVAGRIGSRVGVIATGSHGVVGNCVGCGKRDAIRSVLGGQSFDYIGDSPADVPVWTEAREAFIAGGRRIPRPLLTPQTQASSERSDGPVAGCQLIRLGDHGPGTTVSLLRACRPHQWVKNLLLLAPLFAGHQFHDARKWALGVIAVVVFCAAASAVYLLNDLRDLAADRRHPRKRHRPLAAGHLSVPMALGACGVLLVSAIALAVALPWLSGWMVPGDTSRMAVEAAMPQRSFGFIAWVLGYLVLTTAYTAGLKAVALVDVLLLAGLYVWRLMAGGVAVDVFPSGWLLGFASFLFLSIAFAKRHVELTALQQLGDEKAAGRDYKVTDLPMITTMGLLSGYLSAVVLALYLTSPAAAVLYRSPGWLWLSVGVLVYWVSRLWLLAHRRTLHGDPVVFTLRDPVTWGCGAWVVVLAWLGS